MKPIATRNFLFPCIIFALIFSGVWRLSQIQEKPFHELEWKQAGMNGNFKIRHRMIRSLSAMISDGEIQTHEDVIRILGEPDASSVQKTSANGRSPRSHVSYYLGVDNRFIPSAVYFIRIYFDEEFKIEHFEIRPS